MAAKLYKLITHAWVLEMWHFFVWRGIRSASVFLNHRFGEGRNSSLSVTGIAQPEGKLQKSWSGKHNLHSCSKKTPHNFLMDTPNIHSTNGCSISNHRARNPWQRLGSGYTVEVCSLAQKRNESWYKARDCFWDWAYLRHGWPAGGSRQPAN